LIGVARRVVLDEISPADQVAVFGHGDLGDRILEIKISKDQGAVKDRQSIEGDADLFRGQDVNRLSVRAVGGEFRIDDRDMEWEGVYELLDGERRLDVLGREAQELSADRRFGEASHQADPEWRGHRQQNKYDE
jgi:hypothetical protein